MIQNVLGAMGGIGVYDTISICLFISIFTIALIRTALLKKSYLDEVSALPLQEDEDPVAPRDSRHE